MEAYRQGEGGEGGRKRKKYVLLFEEHIQI